MSLIPPPIPQRVRPSVSGWRKIQIGLALAVGSLLVVFGLLRVFGLIGVYNVPFPSMTPAVSAGDHVFMEGVTYLFRKPKRGDIVVFKTAFGTGGKTELYIKRVAGEPGEHVKISEGQLFVDGKLTTLSNRLGAIAYWPPSGRMGDTMQQPQMEMLNKEYYVLGDRSTNSFDSRSFGPVNGENITGRIWLCYWPPGHIGIVQ